MVLVKPGLLGSELNLNYLRLEMLLHLHPLQSLHLQGQLQLHLGQIDIMLLLLENTCSVGYACNGRLSLNNCVIAQTWSGNSLCKLKCRSWCRLFELRR